MFPDIRSVDETMSTLTHLQEPCPLAKELKREPGRKERRYNHLLGQDVSETTTEQTIA